MTIPFLTPLNTDCIIENMFNLRKLFAFLIFVLTIQNIYSISKEKKYDELLKTGTPAEISEVLSTDNDFYRTTFGKKRNSILMQALEYDRPYEVIRLLSQSGVKMNERNKDKMDAVMFACAYSTQEKVIKYVIRRATKPEDIKNRLLKTSATGKSPADYARENPDKTALKVINILLGLEQETENEETSEQPEKEQQEAEIPEEETQQEEPEQAPLEEDVPSSPSINYNQVYLYDFAPIDQEIEPEESENSDFYAKIENPDKRDRNGRTKLMLAVKDGNDWEVKSLIQSGANVNLQDKDGWTALMYAARFQNNIELTNTLLSSGADPKIHNKYGSSAMQLASSYSNNPAILKRILEELKEDSTEVFKSFILAITAGGNNPVTQIGKLKVFIEHGVPVNRFYEGKTPLMYACEFATTTEVIKLLLDNGAMTKVRTGDGKTAFNFAELNTHLEHNDVYWSLNGK